MRRIDSIALSQYGGDDKINSYECSKAKGFEIISYLLKIKSQTTRFYNVNFPFIFSEIIKSKDYLFTELASQKKADEIIFSQDNNSFSIGKMINHNECVLNSDLETLKKNKISIKRIIQTPNKKDKKATIVIITHKTKEIDARINLLEYKK